MGESRGSRRVREYLVSLWPALPYMGFGLCSAWIALARGTAWLSPVETTGTALTNFLIDVYVAMGMSLLATGLLVGGHAPVSGRLGRLVVDNRVSLVAGILAALSSLVLLMIGPAYFQRTLGGLSYGLFQVSSVLVGVSLGLLYLRLGMLYARLPLRRAILYLCYANLLAVFIYLAVQVSPTWAPVAGSPSLAFMVAFVALPPLAALTFWLVPRPGAPAPSACEQPVAAPDGDCGAPSPFSVRAGTATPRRSLACFAVALMLFAFAQSAVSVAVTNAVPPAQTLGISNNAVLVRIPLLLAFALFASMLEARRLNFGRLLVMLVSLLVVIILTGLVTGIAGAAWLLTVRTVVFGFEVLTWCMIFAVANCHQGQAVAVVAVDFGACALGSGLGSLAGVRAIAAFGEVPLLVACVVALVPCFMLLDERSVEGLFSASSPDGSASSLQTLLGGSLQGAPTRVKGDFQRRLAEYASAKGLSQRETEALRFLVAGRGDNQIAEAMGVSYNTARTHVRNVYNKLGVHDRQTLIDVMNEELR